MFWTILHYEKNKITGSVCGLRIRIRVTKKRIRKRNTALVGIVVVFHYIYLLCCCFFVSVVINLYTVLVKGFGVQSRNLRIFF